MASGIAALIELMSVGKQNKVLNANPQITFWRFTHMRYTDFSLEQVKVSPNSGLRRASRRWTSRQSRRSRWMDGRR